MLIREVQFGVAAAELFAAVHARPHSFFLESGLSAGGLGRFSFLGFAPAVVFRATARAVTLTWTDGRVETKSGEPLEELRALHARFRVERAATDDLPFTGGAVGFFSYEFGMRFERIARRGIDDLAIPEAEFGFYDRIVACEVATGRTYLVVHGRDGAAEAPLADAFERELRAVLAAPRQIARRAAGQPAGEPRSNFARADYLTTIGRIKDYIASGDVYQVNLSQRFATPLPCDAFTLYRRLRERSAAPFASYLGFGDVQVASISPERFVRLRGDRVSTRPIKGTRRRSADPREDAALRAELERSEKDRAELLMIVDLERNDLGRVCRPGSVCVDELFEIEAHPTVWHLVAEVSGQLAPGRDFFDLLRASFPGGSITGAPKVRAMQIIDELEPHRRHLYTGAIGYLGFDGDAEFNIAIRTVQCVGGHAYYHVGGGIVWDSDPAAEYEETLAKGRAIHEALTAPPETAP